MRAVTHDTGNARANPAARRRVCRALLAVLAAIGLAFLAQTPAAQARHLTNAGAAELARDAGFEPPARYLADRDGAAFAFFYAARMDWLRAAIRIGEAFGAEGCIGDYLRRAVSESVPVGIDRLPYRRYGRFFWTDRKRSNRAHVAMMGHGGQQGFIGLGDGRVLLMHAIRGDYKPWRIFRLLFE